MREDDNMVSVMVVDPELFDSLGIFDEDVFDIDANGDKVIAAVKKYGKPCLIKWTRASDSQLGYWGPKGASIRPYIWNK
jgi:hypothetical protein